MPHADENGSRVIVMRAGREEPGRFKMEDLLKVQFDLMEQ